MAKKKTDGLSIEWERKGAYPILFTEDVFAAGNSVLADTLKAIASDGSARLFIVADSNVVQRTPSLGTKIGAYVREFGLTLAASPVVISGGEKIKCDNLQSVMRIVSAMMEARLGVSDVVLAIGGGTLLDVAGYAAAQVRGGLRLVRMPTTVAAMLDAAYAETAAIDGVSVKDALRVCSHPSAVIVDPTFARTVLDGVWRGGIGEAVRYAAVNDAPLLKRLVKRASALHERDYAALTDTIRETVESRAKKGSGSFALWSAARLEEMSGYKLPHGYAVAIGICIDCAYAVNRGFMKEDDQELVCRILADCGALDGLSHSHHLLAQGQALVEGLASWTLSSGENAVTLPGALGKGVIDEEPSTDSYLKVIGEFLAVSRSE